jgi:hypothetical protein
MALITCPKCGKQFSEHALACPQCGISKGEALVLIEKNAEEMRLAAEREAAERERQQQEYYAEQERLRQERLAKEAEEARIRAEKRAEWWAANKRKVGIIFAIIVGVIIALIVVVKISRSILEKKAIAEAYTLIEEGDKLVASKQFENAREMYDKAFQITENHEVRNEISKKCSDLDLAIKKEQDKYNDGLPGLFSVSPTKKVRFSKGNLQYQASTNTWRFAENQYDMSGKKNKNISDTYSGWIDLFGWGTGKDPTLTSTDYIYDTFNDWGHNTISNGGDKNNHWHVLTEKEWKYIIEERANAENKINAALVNGIRGCILLPDDWQTPRYLSWDGGCNKWETNQYTKREWIQMEQAGAVFLPAAGFRFGTDEIYENVCSYWSSTLNDAGEGDRMAFLYNDWGAMVADTYSWSGNSVRLVRNITDSSALMLDLVGTIGSSQGHLVYDEVKSKGSYEYSLPNATVKRNIALDSHEGDKLSLTSHDLSGKYIGKFDGTLSTKDNHLYYSGTFTNYKGVSLNFKLTQR